MSKTIIETRFTIISFGLIVDVLRGDQIDDAYKLPQTNNSPEVATDSRSHIDLST